MVVTPAVIDSQFVLCVAALLVAPSAPAGLALTNCGLGRARSAAHSLMSAMCAVAVSVLAYIAIGRAFHGVPGGPEARIMAGGKEWGWIGNGPFFLRGVSLDATPLLLAAWFGAIAVATASVVPIGTGAERWRLRAVCLSAAITGGLVLPLAANWAWGGGWLGSLGFVDAGGGTINVVGGFAALSMAWLLGPRRGKHAYDGTPMAIPGHNAIYIIFGSLLTLAGWTGINCAGALLLTGAQPSRLALVAINTLLGASCGALGAAVMTKSRFGKPDSSLTANGWVGGLVATSAACPFLHPASAILIGLAAGALVAFSVEMLDLHLDIDDPGGSVSVHATGGIWGLLAGGALGRFPVNGDGQFVAQLIGVGALIAVILPLTFGLHWLVDRFVGHRATPDDERQGLDLAELGAGAYPEFVTHTDDFLPR